jgi:hypothetical protein
VRHSLARATSLGAMVRSRQRCAQLGRCTADCRAAVQCSRCFRVGCLPTVAAAQRTPNRSLVREARMGGCAEIGLSR